MLTRNVVLATIAFGSSLLADTQFQVRQTSRGDIPGGKGQCDIRLRIDGEAEVAFRGTQVYIRNLRGQDGQDEGSECNMPVPANPVNFNFEKRDGRGEMRVVDELRRGVVVYIRDEEGGAGRYHFRLSWDADASGRGGGFNRPNFPNDRYGNDRYGNRSGGIFDNPGYGRSGVGVFDNLNSDVRGDGNLNYNGGNLRIRRVSLDLRRGGRFVLTFEGQGSDTITGNWRFLNNGQVQLDVDRTGNNRADGGGTAYLRGNQVSSINLSGRDQRGGNFNLNFNAR